MARHCTLNVDKNIVVEIDLFSLGREGLELQMRAYLDNKEVNGEIIKARAFRECFRIVTAAVKGLGLPSDQKRPATDAIYEEVAAALEATQETVALSESTKESELPN